MPLIFNPKALVAARKQSRLTQEKIAQAMGCRRQWIAQIESGAHKPNLKTLERLWAVLRIQDPRPFFAWKTASTHALKNAPLPPCPDAPEPGDRTGPRGRDGGDRKDFGGHELISE